MGMWNYVVYYCEVSHKRTIMELVKDKILMNDRLKNDEHDFEEGLEMIDMEGKKTGMILQVMENREKIKNSWNGYLRMVDSSGENVLITN